MAQIKQVELDDQFADFVGDQLVAGNYASASDVVHDGLKLLRERQAKIEALRQALIEGEESGPAGPLDMEEIKRKARALAARAA